MRSLRTARKSSPCSPQREKARAQQRRPNAAKIKNKINKFFKNPKHFRGLKLLGGKYSKVKKIRDVCACGVGKVVLSVQGGLSIQTTLSGKCCFQD